MDAVIDDMAVDAAMLQFNTALVDAGVDDCVMVLAYVADNGLAAAMASGVTPTDRDGCSGLWMAAMSALALHDAKRGDAISQRRYSRIEP